MRGVSNPFLALPTNRAAKPGVHRSGYGPDFKEVLALQPFLTRPEEGNDAVGGLYALTEG
jgi:hypothetical protein